MIQNTKFKMVKNAGTPFLVWGYMTVELSLLQIQFCIRKCFRQTGMIKITDTLILHLHAGKLLL